MNTRIETVDIECRSVLFSRNASVSPPERCLAACPCALVSSPSSSRLFHMPVVRFEVDTLMTNEAVVRVLSMKQTDQEPSGPDRG